VNPSADWQPLLRGELIELRPLRADDYDGLYAVASDPLIWEQHPIKSRHEPAVFRQFFDEAIARRGALVVIDAASRRIIGSSRFHGHDPARREVEIGWTFLARAYWGGRYNREMKRLMIEHAFRFVDVVIFVVGVGNIRSQRAMEKIGGVRRAGTRRESDGRESYEYEVRKPRC